MESFALRSIPCQGWIADRKANWLAAQFYKCGGDRGGVVTGSLWDYHRIEAAMLGQQYGDGDESSSLAAFELAEITRSIQMESEIQKQTSYRDMVATPAKCKRTLISVFLGVFENRREDKNRT